MAFLFKSKKHQEKVALAAKIEGRDGQSGAPVTQAAVQSGRPRDDEKGAMDPRTTPSSSVNNSLSSLPGVTEKASVPSPEQQNVRRIKTGDMSSDLPVSYCLPICTMKLQQ